MRPPIAEHSHLAGAFLALADDPESSPGRRSLARTVCAAAAALVLAFAAPLAWAAPAAAKPDLPAATALGKAGVVADDDEDDLDGGPEGGDTWAATDA